MRQPALLDTQHSTKAIIGGGMCCRAVINVTRKALLPEVELWIFAEKPLTAKIAKKNRKERKGRL